MSFPSSTSHDTEQTDTDQANTDQADADQADADQADSAAGTGVGSPAPAEPATRRQKRAAGRRRRAALMAAVAVLALVGTGGAIAAANHKTVTLDVDGQEVEVSTFTRDIAGLLENQGIALTERDLVVPEPHERLHDGSQVVVRTAQQVEVVLDGEVSTVWTTALSAEEALAQLNAGGRDVAFAASRSGAGRAALGMPVIRGGTVLVEADGQQREVSAAGELDLDAVLLLAEVRLSPADRVAVEMGEDGAVLVSVTRVEAREDSYTEVIEHGSQQRETSALYTGQSRVAQEGADGERTFYVAQILIDGEVESSKLIGSEVTTEPQDRIVEVGTAQRPPPPPAPRQQSSGSSSGQVSSDVWARLAQCESSGNPGAISPSGTYHGLYQFSVPTWRSVGGTGLPSQASPAEQTMRAQMLQARSGWGQWPHCSRVLGLR